MRSIYFLLATIICLQTASVAQSGYIVKDSAYIQGQIFDLGLFRNNREVKFTTSKKLPPTIYYPKDLVEYGLDDNIYVSKPVQDGEGQNPYFLLRLENGKSKLYLLKTRNGKRLFSESNGTLIELKKDSFRETLTTTLVNTESLKSQIGLVKFKKKSLTRFFSLHNKSYTGLFPTIRKGVLGGVSSTAMYISDEGGTSVSLGNDLSPFLGVFIEIPLGLKPMLSLSYQAVYRENSYSKFVHEANRDLDFLVNTASVNFPVLFKYHSTSLKFRSYLIAGPSFTYYLKRENQVLETTSTGSIVEINKIPINGIPQYQAEGVLGVGFEYSVKPKNPMGIELRYNKGFGDQSLSSFQLIGSIYF